MTATKRGHKPTPDKPATGVGSSLTKTEYRMVVTVPGQRQERYPKRNAERAAKAIADFAKDQTRSPYYRNATAHIEQREVTEWHTAN